MDATKRIVFYEFKYLKEVTNMAANPFRVTIIQSPDI